MPYRPIHLLLSSLLALAAAGVLAQTPPASDRDKLSDAERARRDAEKVFSFIKFHTVRPAAPAAAARPAPPARPAAAPQAAAAAAAAGTAAAAPLAAAPAPSPAPAALASVPAPAAAPAALAPSTPTAAQGLGTPQPGISQPPQAEPAPSLPNTSAAAALPEPVPAPEPDDEVPLKLLAYTPPEMNAQVMDALGSRPVVVPVRFTVQPNGRVSEARSLATGGVPRRVAQAAVRAVQQWRFEPIPAVREVDVEIAFKASD